jgi:hypothetical protein
MNCVVMNYSRVKLPRDMQRRAELPRRPGGETRRCKRLRRPRKQSGPGAKASRAAKPRNDRSQLIMATGPSACATPFMAVAHARNSERTFGNSTCFDTVTKDMGLQLGLIGLC